MFAHNASKYYANHLQIALFLSENIFPRTIKTFMDYYPQHEM